MPTVVDGGERFLFRAEHASRLGRVLMTEQVDIAVDLGAVPPPPPEILGLRRLEANCAGAAAADHGRAVASGVQDDPERDEQEQ